jgi:hypothetical protein
MKFLMSLLCNRNFGLHTGLDMPCLNEVSRSLSVSPEVSECPTINYAVTGSFHTFRFVVLTASTYSQQVSRLFIFHLITLKHTPHSAGILWTRDRPVAETSTWQHTNTHKRQTSMPPLGFEPTIPESARPQTYALDRAATGIGSFHST